MLYGERFVKNQYFKEWVNSWSIGESELSKVNCILNVVNDKTIEFLELQIASIKEFANSLSEEDDWRLIQGMCSKLIYELFFKHDDYSIKIGNFYECFLIPCDIETKKQLIEGFDYKQIGRVNIVNEGKLIATIGEKSDIIWSVFYDDFILESDHGSITHVLDHEEYLTLQFWDDHIMGNEEIQEHIDDLLYACSVEKNLNFKVVSIPKKAKDRGIEGQYQIEYNPKSYEKIPMMYFKNGFQTQDYRLSFLSYYQVLEYFFIRAQNNNLIEMIMEDGTTDIKDISHYNLRNALRKYNNSTREKKSLKLVLSQIVVVSELKMWINTHTHRVSTFTTNALGEASIVLDLSKSDDKIISRLAERIYYFRCGIAHAKGDTGEYIVIPNSNDFAIFKELEMMKYLSMKTLECYA